MVCIRFQRHKLFSESAVFAALWCHVQNWVFPPVIAVKSCSQQSSGNEYVRKRLLCPQNSRMGPKVGRSCSFLRPVSMIQAHRQTFSSHFRDLKPIWNSLSEIADTRFNMVLTIRATACPYFEYVGLTYIYLIIPSYCKEIRLQKCHYPGLV